MIKINSGLRKYMAFDLATLILIGCLLEGFTTKICSLLFMMAPTITFALLITIVAITRWNLWGLIVIPFLAGATWIGGMNASFNFFAVFYDWRVFTSEIVGLSTVGLNVILYKLKTTRRIVKTMWKVLLMALVNYFIYCLVQALVYRICCGDILGNAQIIVKGSKPYISWFDSEGNSTFKIITPEEPQNINVCDYSELGAIYNLFGLAVALIGSAILKSQGVLCNAVEKLIDDKKEAEFNNLNTVEFRISEEDDEEENKSESNDEKSSAEDESSL